MIYQKQRGTIRWIKCGDVGSKFFHSTATIRHRKKLITSLKSDNNEEFFSHDTKMLWMAYKERLGSSTPINLSDNLEDLIIMAESGDTRGPLHT